MTGGEFRSGTPLHGLCLVACALIALIAIALERRCKSQARKSLTRKLLGTSCLLVWCTNTAYWAAPSRFTWEQGLPLHYCNLANLIGGLAVLSQRRVLQALIYFWALALCVWAFLTPTVRYGPFHPEFWLFWTYHLFILLSVTHVLTVDRYRPSFRDLLHVSAFTATYTLMLVIINYAFGWNYGFVGPSVPKSPTLIDALGTYPLRLVWISLLAALLFIACLLPWCWHAKSSARKH